MPENIVICCDGMLNEFCRHNTNVVKLAQLLETDPLRQTVYYHPGLGTMEAVAALSSVARLPIHNINGTEACVSLGNRHPHLPPFELSRAHRGVTPLERHRRALAHLHDRIDADEVAA